MLRLALVGCGAIAESFHGPALAALAKGRATIVAVDPDLERARSLARTFGFEGAAANHDEIGGTLDAAILATPHHLHVPIALDLVARGTAVLSEKPLGTSVAEIARLRDAAAEAGVVVAVNQTRRFIPACLEIHRQLKGGELGRIESVEMAEGDKFGWPAATPSMFGASSGGKGVLLDIGVHALDLATWWFGDELALERYEDDSFGGSEAAVQARFLLGSAPVSLRLSWLAKQANRYIIRGDKGVLEWEIYDLDRVYLSAPDGRNRQVRKVSGSPLDFAALSHRVLADFLNAVEHGTPPMVTADDALASMKLIEACYTNRTRFDMPWHAFSLEGAHAG